MSPWWTLAGISCRFQLWWAYIWITGMRVSEAVRNRLRDVSHIHVHVITDWDYASGPLRIMNIGSGPGVDIMIAMVICSLMRSNSDRVIEMTIIDGDAPSMHGLYRVLLSAQEVLSSLDISSMQNEYARASSLRKHEIVTEMIAQCTHLYMDKYWENGTGEEMDIGSEYVDIYFPGTYLRLRAIEIYLDPETLVARVSSKLSGMTYDYVIMKGLMDYFDLDGAIQLVRAMRGHLVKGGIFVTTNIRPMAEKYALHTVVGWLLMHYKTDEEFMKIIRDAGFKAGSIELFSEPQGIFNIAICKED